VDAKSGERVAKIIRAEITIFAIQRWEEAPRSRIATIGSAQIPVIANHRSVCYVTVDAHINRALVSVINVDRIGITKSI